MEVKIEWVAQGVSASEADIKKLEKKQRIQLSKEHREFLSCVANGGHPSTVMPIPTSGDCPEGAGDLDAVYGISHREAYCSLEVACQEFRTLLPDLIPFGYDEGNGQLFVDMLNRPGRLVYIPWDEFFDRPLKPYHVANSITEFLQLSSDLAAQLHSGSVNHGGQSSRNVGARTGDFRRANENRGKRKEPGYTWYHHQDPGRMQLVPTLIHRQVRHPGSFKAWPRDPNP